MKVIWNQRLGVTMRCMWNWVCFIAAFQHAEWKNFSSWIEKRKRLWWPSHFFMLLHVTKELTLHLHRALCLWFAFSCCWNLVMLLLSTVSLCFFSLVWHLWFLRMDANRDDWWLKSTMTLIKIKVWVFLKRKSIEKAEDWYQTPLTDPYVNNMKLDPKWALLSHGAWQSKIYDQSQCRDWKRLDIKGLMWMWFVLQIESRLSWPSQFFLLLLLHVPKEQTLLQHKSYECWYAESHFHIAACCSHWCLARWAKAFLGALMTYIRHSWLTQMCEQHWKVTKKQ